jgi:hypothetical protein
VEPKNRTIARMQVERAIRLRPAEGAAEPAEPPPQKKGLICSKCGAVICDPVRAKMMAGIVLKCTGCGEPNRAA